MQLQKVRAAFTTIIVALCLTMISQTTQAQPDVSKIMTYEALRDTFMAYTNNVEVKTECLQALGHLKDSMKVSPTGHETAISTLISVGFHDTTVRGEALYQIVLFQLHNYEDTIFALLKPDSTDYFWELARIGGHRTSEYFKSIIQHYNFDKYELQTISALAYMNDSAFYLIPDIKKYRDSIEYYYGKNCPPSPLENSRCWDLYTYRGGANAAVDHLEYMQSLHHTDIANPPKNIIVQPQVNSPAGIEKSGCIYTPDGKLMRGPLIKNGVYIKDGKLIVNMENGK